jgi:hypothetical protein
MRYFNRVAGVLTFVGLIVTTPGPGKSSSIVSGVVLPVSCGALPALTGDTTSTVATCLTTTAKINGTAFPASALFVNSNGSAQPGALTAVTATAALNTFTSSLQGLAPASGGGTSNFLRADGGWATPAGTGVPTVATPYLVIGSTYYTQSRFMATRPSGTPTWINSVTPGTVTAGANGDILTSGSGTFWASLTATASVEGEMSIVNLTNTAAGNTISNGGVWLYDSTNGIIWKWYVEISATTPSTSGASALAIDKYTYMGTGNPAYSATPVVYNFPNGSAPVHLKIVKASTTLSFYVSMDGGATFAVVGQTESVGTISNGGYGTAGNTAMTVFSIQTT